MTQDRPPRLVARLETDQSGRPAFVKGDDKRHYKLVFEVENAPKDTYAATFELDPTYYDPMRTVSPGDDGQFRLQTTTYGDYDLQVRLRTKTGEIPLIDSVSRALQRWRSDAGPKSDPAVDEAISYIANH